MRKGSISSHVLFNTHEKWQPGPRLGPWLGLLKWDPKPQIFTWDLGPRARDPLFYLIGDRSSFFCHGHTNILRLIHCVEHKATIIFQKKTTLGKAPFSSYHHLQWPLEKHIFYNSIFT